MLPPTDPRVTLTARAPSAWMLPFIWTLLATSVAPVSTTMLPLRRVPFRVHLRLSGTTTLSSWTAPIVPVQVVVSANDDDVPVDEESH